MVRSNTENLPKRTWRDQKAVQKISLGIYSVPIFCNISTIPSMHNNKGIARNVSMYVCQHNTRQRMSRREHHARRNSRHISIPIPIPIHSPQRDPSKQLYPPPRTSLLSPKLPLHLPHTLLPLQRRALPLLRLHLLPSRRRLTHPLLPFLSLPLLILLPVV